MEENIQQNTTPEAIPWTISDIAKGALAAIGIAIAIGIVLGIPILIIMGTTDPQAMQDIAKQNLTQTEKLQQMLDILKAHGRFNITLILMFAMMMLGEAAIPLGAWLFSARKYHCGWSSLGFKKFDVKKGIGLAILVTVLGLAIAIGWTLLLQKCGIEATDTSAMFKGSGIGVALFAILAVFVAPFAEEPFFRGFMFQGIKKRLGFAGAAIISALLFAAAHMDFWNLAPIFILGLMLAWLFNKTQSIWPCILVHFAFNSISVISMVKS